MTFSLYQGDAIEALRMLPDESVDLIITDTAYESLEKHRKVGTTTRLKHSKSSSNDWFPIFPNARFPELFAECWRVLKRNTHFYFHCDAETMFVAKPMAEAVGFKFWKPLVWDKGSIGMGYHYRNQHEFILFFEKGKRKLNDLSISDVLPAKRVRNGYPTEKPLGISTTLVEQSSAPGQIVLDPFCGSGGVGVAAVQGHRHFLGADIALKACLISQAKMCAAGGEQRAWENLFVKFHLVGEM
jgi:site-specific DNA-methyltransferase (adenine-specific)